MKGCFVITSLMPFAYFNASLWILKLEKSLAYQSMLKIYTFYVLYFQKNATKKRIFGGSMLIQAESIEHTF